MAFAPFHDRQGRFSVLKTGVFLAVFVPALWVGVRFWLDDLGAKPVDAAIHEIGLWSLRLLLVTLAITPSRLVTGVSRLILVRRMLGLSSLAYAMVHFALYVVLMKGWLWRVVMEIALRPYLTIGFISLAAMLALGATSTDSAVRRMGALNWQRLHALVSPIAVLAIAHAFMQAKIDVSEPAVMAGIFAGLMLARFLRIKGQLPPLRAFAVVLAAGIAAALSEIGWYGLFTGLPWERVAQAAIDPAMQPRPALLAMLWMAPLPGLAALMLRSKEVAR